MYATPEVEMRRTLLVLGLFALVTACTPGGGDAGEGDGDPAVPESVYAYLTFEAGQSVLDTHGTFALMDGTRTIASTDVFLTNPPVFTTDGRFVYVASSTDQTVTVIATDTGAITTVDCEGCGDVEDKCLCQEVVPFGGSTIAWLDGEHRLTVVDLAASPPAPTHTETTVPEIDGFLDEKIAPALFAGTDGAALATYPSGLPGDDIPPVYLLTPDAEPRRLDTGRKDATDLAAFSPDGTKVALAGTQEYTCGTVTVVDVASGEGTDSTVKAEPGATCEQPDVYPADLWWDHDGVLNLYFQSPKEATVDPDTHAHRRLEGERWVQVGAVNTRTVRLPSGATAFNDLFTLYFEYDGERTVVSEDVTRVTAAPV